MPKQTDGRLILQFELCLFGWVLHRQKKQTVNGVVRYFVRKGFGNLIETDLIVAIRTETNAVQPRGNFTVNYATFTRFFALHFLISFLIATLVLIHFLFIQQTRSNNPLG